MAAVQVIVMSPGLSPLTRQQSDNSLGDRVSQGRYPRLSSYPRLTHKSLRLFQARAHASWLFLLQTIVLAAAVERPFAIPASPLC